MAFLLHITTHSDSLYAIDSDCLLHVRRADGHYLDNTGEGLRVVRVSKTARNAGTALEFEFEGGRTMTTSALHPTSRALLPQDLREKGTWEPGKDHRANPTAQRAKALAAAAVQFREPVYC